MEDQVILSNLCKVLGVLPPAQLESTDRQTALKHLAEIPAKLTSSKS